MWFVYEGEAFVIYSQKTAENPQHIARNPLVSLHFDGGARGEDIQVFLGTAEIFENPTPTNENKAYSEKSHRGIIELGATDKSFA